MVNSFTFYYDYYYLLDTLNKKDKRDILEAIVDYIFKDMEPSLEGHNKAIFNTLKHQLDKSKQQSKRSKKNEPNENRKKTGEKPEKNQIKTEKVTKQKQNSILSFKFYILSFKFKNIKNINESLVIKKIIEWLEYKQERKDKYTEKGLNSLLTKIDNLLNEYEEQEIIELIDNSIVNNWKGIIWDNLKTKNKKTKEPSWFKNKTETEEMTKEEQEEMENILKEFGG